jgi:hypothetical protein
MAHAPATAERLPLVVYTAAVWLRGLVELRGSVRLTDVLNQSASPVLVLVEGDVLPVGAAERPATPRPLVVNKAEVLLAYPAVEAEPAGTAAGLRVPRFRLDVGMHLGEYQVQGTIHLPDIVAWTQYLAALRGRFLPLTGASVRRAATGELLATASYVAVNRDRLSVLYEL